MTKLFFTLLSLLATAQIFAQTDLKQRVEQIISTKKADIGVSIKSSGTGGTMDIRGNQHYPMISIFKFHIALAVLNKVDNKQLSLKQKIFVRKDELLEDTWSPFRERYPKGDIQITLEEALRWTVSHSDNNLGDLLIRLAGGVKAISNFLNDPSFIIKNNEEEMHKSWDAQFLNTTTPNFSTRLLDDFYNEKILSRKSTKLLYEMLVETSVGLNRIKGKLPKETEVAHRTGSSFTNKEGLTGAINDIGIVKLPDGNYFIISVFVHNTTERYKDGEEIIADIAKAAWDYYTSGIAGRR